MGELASALDALAAEDLHGLPSPALLERTAELVKARNRIDAELARTTRRADLAQAPEHDGQKTMASWLRGHCRPLAARAGFAIVRAGRALDHLPAVAAAFAAGLITADQLAVIAPVIASGERGQGRRPAASTCPTSTECSPTSPPPSRTTSSARSWRTTWPASTPTAPNPTPPRAGR